MIDAEDELDDEKLEQIRLEALSTIQRIIEENRDLTVKDIGDRVIVWDVSRLTDYDTNQLVERKPYANTPILLMNYESIVIETGSDYKGLHSFYNQIPPKTLDLVIWNSQLNKKFRTSSDFVKIRK